ncbi:dienelactone hydrolase family protein [Cellulomonas sp. P24]|uniref:dienelactone hydrolase family protein n=1 Tax=Cellulomonas sp. P24 TaxID=2885206 RepID=UPI00216AC6A2|nr:dienelactone hydrolase family protein [Cellulomonas sp. P24]MCR6491905.1 dienelactone hydrolase family protein [Cellulomonas sp. P24]
MTSSISDPLLVDLLAREPLPAVPIRTMDVRYDHDGTTLLGHLAMPGGDGPFPGVLVVHDWFGVGDHVRVRCELLARLGYAAFAADIYGEGVRPATGPEASEVARGFYADLPLLRARAAAGLARLAAEPAVDASRLAAIGYCFGGSTVLQLARSGADLAGVVSFHGGLQVGPPGEAAAITASVLVLTGAADPVVPDSAIVAFQDELRQAPGVEWQIVTYSGAMHAFSVPGTDAPAHGAQFQATAERRSWVAMKDLLAEVLG